VKAVNVNKLTYIYPDGVIALKEIDFSLEDGVSLGVIGPNGAGKTTLLFALCGLLESTHNVQIYGQEISKKNAQNIRSWMSFVFQNPDDQLFMPTIYEDIAFGLKQLGCSQKEVDSRVYESLKAVGLNGFGDRSSHHCSYGEKRKITLAIALTRKSRLLIFDEPTRELDPGGRREFIKLLKNIWATKIIASHDLDLILETCSDVILINNGEVVAEGCTKDTLSNWDLMEDNRLEVPYLLR